MTYDELIALVRYYAHRQDLDSLMPRFFQQATDAISKVARLLSMETRATLTVTDNVAALPSGFIQFRSVSQDAAKGRQPLTSYERNRFEEQKRAYPGGFYGYTIDANEVEVAKDLDINTVYYAKPAIVTGGATNTVLTSNPNLYVFAMLMYIHKAVQDYESFETSRKQFYDEVVEANEADEHARRSGDAPQMTAR